MSKPYRDQTPAPQIDSSQREVGTSPSESATADRPHTVHDAASSAFAKLFYAIAHDLRGPMSTITASASILSYEGVSEEDRLECADYILRSVQKMKDLLEEASEVLELEACDEAIRGSTRPLSEITTRAIDSVADRAGTSGVALTDTVEDTIDDHLLVRCDADLLTRAFQLLLTTCIDAPEATGVSLRASREDQTIRVEVIDDGAQVPEVDIPRLFDRFWERDRGRRPKIGLAMRAIDRIVRQHAGEVCAEARPQGGMRFVIFLPAAAPSRGPTKQTKKRGREMAARSSDEL